MEIFTLGDTETGCIDSFYRIAVQRNYNHRVLIDRNVYGAGYTSSEMRYPKSKSLAFGNIVSQFFFWPLSLKQSTMIAN